MRMIKQTSFLALVTLIFSAAVTLQGQTRAYQVSDSQVLSLITRIETNTNSFRRQIGRNLNRSSADGTRQEDSINALVGQFETATNRLRNNFASRRSTSEDVQQVLDRAVAINQLMLNSQLSAAAESNWVTIRNDLNTLAGYYRLMAADWNTGRVAGGGNAYSVGDPELETLFRSIETSTNTFRRQMGRNLDRSSADGTNTEDSINAMVANFENATDRLRNNFRSRRSTTADVQEVLNRAVAVNRFMVANRMSPAAENTWNRIRADLNTLAGYYRVALADWNSVPIIPGTVGDRIDFTVSDSQVRNLITRLRTRQAAFRTNYDRWSLRRSGGTNISSQLLQLETAIDQLNHMDRRNVSRSLIDDILRPAAEINRYLNSERANSQVTASWNLVRGDLETLATYSRYSWNWDNPVFDGSNTGMGLGSFDTRLTGTYRLNSRMSDNSLSAIDRAMADVNYPANQRDRVRRTLERRLASPETIVLEKRGRQVIMATDQGQQVTMDASGTVQTETSPNGRAVRTSVIATDRELTINYEGDRMNDYFVSFTPSSNGQLRVSRRIYLEGQNETVTVASVYDKISPIAQWPSVTPMPNGVGLASEGYIVPNNTGLVATLDTALSARDAKNGDRFSMTVNSPSQYSGAVIQGTVVGERSGVFTGRSSMQLSFDTIRMRDGRTFRFAGIVDQVRDAAGNTVQVNNEGQIRDSSQTNRTVTRAGIGALLGAIIGAVAGGGEGAAIGAGVGAGAGAGTVILQGRDNLQLNTGSQFSITAAAPSNATFRQ